MFGLWLCLGWFAVVGLSLISCLGLFIVWFDLGFGFAGGLICLVVVWGLSVCWFDVVFGCWLYFMLVYDITFVVWCFDFVVVYFDFEVCLFWLSLVRSLWVVLGWLVVVVGWVWLLCFRYF